MLVIKAKNSSNFVILAIYQVYNMIRASLYCGNTIREASYCHHISGPLYQVISYCSYYDQHCIKHLYIFLKPSSIEQGLRMTRCPFTISVLHIVSAPTCITNYTPDMLLRFLADKSLLPFISVQNHLELPTNNACQYSSCQIGRRRTKTSKEDNFYFL